MSQTSTESHFHRKIVLGIDRFHELVKLAQIAATTTFKLFKDSLRARITRLNFLFAFQFCKLEPFLEKVFLDCGNLLSQHTLLTLVVNQSLLLTLKGAFCRCYFLARLIHQLLQFCQILLRSNCGLNCTQIAACLELSLHKLLNLLVNLGRLS